MWRNFFTFEVAVLVLCWVSVILLTEGPTTVSTLHDLVAEVQTALGKVPMSHDAQQQARVLGDATPEELLSLYWMRRTKLLPYRSWYLHSSQAYSSIPPSQRLPPSVMAEGQVVYPMHAIYLYVCMGWLRLVRPQLAQSILSSRAQPLLTHAEAGELRQAFAWVSVACVLVVGVPGTWCLFSAIVQLLRRAASDRERAACQQLPADVCERVAASTMRLAPAPGRAAASAAAAAAGSITPQAPEGRDVGPSVASREVVSLLRPWSTEVATSLGALTVVLLSLLPLLSMELSTFQPWCLCGSLIVWCVYCVLQNELQLHPATLTASDAAFDLTTPLVVEGAVEFFGLKHRPSLRPLIVLSILLAVLVLTMTPCLYVVPIFLIWALSACWQHGFRRVLVRVKVPNGARDPSADSDGYARVGYSCYRDRLHMYHCFGYSTVLGLSLALALTTPFWLHQQPLMAFTELFASPSKKSPASVKAGVDLSSLSFTGGHELHARCLTGAYQYYTCTLPTPNMWRLTEWFGMPWTGLAKGITKAFTLDRQYVNLESPLWLNYGMVVLLVLANGVSLLVLTFYRVRKPPLTFETPVEYATERAAQRAAVDAYFAQKRLARGAPAPPKSNKAQKSPPGTGDGAERKRVKIVTCVSREEYLVKQVVLVAWMLSISSLSCTLFVLKTRPSSSAIVFPCSSLLAAVYAVVSVLRREQPLAFYPMPDVEQRQAPSKAQQAENGEKRSGAGTAEEAPAPSAASARAATSVLTQRDRDDPRPPAASRWCTTSAAPSLAHVADVSWLYATFAAAELGTVALTWLTMPLLLHQGIAAAFGVGVAVSLVLLRRRTRTDTTSTVFLMLGGLSCVLLVLLLIGQAIPQSAGFATAGRPVSVVDKVGDVYSNSSETVLRFLIYQCAVAAVVYLCCLVHATLRLGQLALEPEEMRIVPVEDELSFFKKGEAANAAASAPAGTAAAAAQRKQQ